MIEKAASLTILHGKHEYPSCYLTVSNIRVCRKKADLKKDLTRKDAGKQTVFNEAVLMGKKSQN